MKSPAFYRANTRGRLRNLAGATFKVTVEFMPAPRPFFHYFAPVALVELLITRLTRIHPFEQFSTTLLITM